MNDEDRNEPPTDKMQKVTTFKLTEDLSRELDLIKDRDGCSKDAAIRRMIQLGLQVDRELQHMTNKAVWRVAQKGAAKKTPKLIANGQ